MNRSDSIASLATALAKANLEMSNPVFDKKNPHYNSGYASLAAVLNAIREPLAKHGLSLIQTISTEPGSVTITTSLIHASGEWLSADVSVAVQNNATAQAVGSATSYMRRYSALAMCGIAGDNADDDGEEDRRDREERKPMPAPTRSQRTTRATFQPKKAQGAAPAPAPAAPPAPPTPPEPASPAKSDRFPDDFNGEVTVRRVLRRPGHPHAIHVQSADHGMAWVSTKVDGYADCLEEAVNEKRIVEVWRNGNALELIAVRNCAQPAPTGEEVNANDLPF